MSVCVYACECRYLWRTEDSTEFSRAGNTGVCGYPDLKTSKWPETSTEHHVFLTTEPSIFPFLILQLFYKE